MKVLDSKLDFKIQFYFFARGVNTYQLSTDSYWIGNEHIVAKTLYYATSATVTIELFEKDLSYNLIAAQTYTITSSGDYTAAEEGNECYTTVSITFNTYIKYYY